MSRKVYILSSPWLRAAAEFRRLADKVELFCGRWRWVDGVEGVEPDPRLFRELVFIWGNGDEYGQPLFDDMRGPTYGPSAFESAAQVAESLAYDNTDGPADEVT